MVAVISKIVFSSIAIVTTSICPQYPYRVWLQWRENSELFALSGTARASARDTEFTVNKDHTGCWSFACSPCFFLKICPVLIQASEIANNDAYIPQISRALHAKCFSQTLFYFCLSCTCVFCSRVFSQIFWEPIRIEIRTTNPLHHGKFGTSVSGDAVRV